jgi:hypothetical protein
MQSYLQIFNNLILIRPFIGFSPNCFLGLLHCRRMFPPAPCTEFSRHFFPTEFPGFPSFKKIPDPDIGRPEPGCQAGGKPPPPRPPPPPGAATSGTAAAFLGSLRALGQEATRQVASVHRRSHDSPITGRHIYSFKKNRLKKTCFLAAFFNNYFYPFTFMIKNKFDVTRSWTDRMIDAHHAFYGNHFA